jgi:hypothetical protein
VGRLGEHAKFITSGYTQSTTKKSKKDKQFEQPTQSSLYDREESVGLTGDDGSIPCQGGPGKSLRDTSL